MTDFKHTPGEWIVDPGSFPGELLVRSMQEGEDLMDICSLDVNEGNNPMADAKLIAAAPVMREALRKMISEILPNVRPKPELPGAEHFALIKNWSDLVTEIKEILNKIAR